ncbi:MAG: phosphatase [Butyricicoccaceae bacterium]
MKIIADLHTHTIASTHAYSTVDEMAAAAARAGLQAIAITDHGPLMADAPHHWHFANMVEFPRRIHGVYVLRGIEYNTLPPCGGIDGISLKVAEWLDFSLASLHEPCFEPADERAHNIALEGILRNPYVTCFGHLGNLHYPFDHERIISQCNAFGKIVEINNHSLTVREGCRENCMDIARLCAQYRVPVLVNSDSHSAYTVGKVDGALEMLEEIDFPEELVLNADLERLRQFFLERRGIDICG